MIRVRLTSTAVSVLLLLLLILALTGCASSQTAPRRPTASSTRPTLLAPTPASTALARTDPAVWAAVQFEQAHCAWSWRQSRQSYLAGQQKLATPAYAAQLAAASDPVTWRNLVQVQKQTVTCTVSDAARDTDAPSSPTTVYARMALDTEITSTLGTFAGGQRIAFWLVTRTASGWRVAGSFEGG